MDPSPRSPSRVSSSVPLPLAPGPLPAGPSWRAVAGCVGASAEMLARGRLWQPTEHLGRSLSFADATSARVYRETRVDREPPSDPCVLLIGFRLRWVRGRGHAAFERESLAHTVLFAGFPGLVSKLWLGHDEHDLYRGLYEWDGPQLADTYARSLWHVLALVSTAGSIDFRVLDGLRRDELLADPVRSLAAAPADVRAWWRVTGSAPPAGPLPVRRLSLVRDASR
jgi:hypothetical protein